jgi:hypothetical protein
VDPDATLRTPAGVHLVAEVLEGLDRSGVRAWPGSEEVGT